MLTINLIREKSDFVIERLKVKNFDARPVVEKVLELDAARRLTQKKSDDILSEMNRISKDIGALIKNGKSAEAE